MSEFIRSKQQLLQSFGSDSKTGLTDETVSKNRAEYGSNTLTKEKPVSLWRRIVLAGSEPMILMLIGAGILALFVNVLRYMSGGEGDFWECVGIFAAISLSVIITVIMEGKSAKAFEALSRMSADKPTKVLRDGQTLLINQTELVVGDIILLDTGDVVPADAVLLESTALRADEAALTGESVPSGKNSEFVPASADVPLAERKDMLFSGTFITAGHGKAVVTAVGDQSEFGKIARELSGTAHSSTPLQEKLGALGKKLTILGIAAASVVFTAQIIMFYISGTLRLDRILDALVTAVVLIVAAVPEGLPTIVAVSLSVGVIKLSKKNALVKKMIASETVGCVNVICSDKTGTLTENKMTVTEFYDAEQDAVVQDITREAIAHGICLNSTADISETGEFLGNPTECALLAFYEKSDARKTSGRSYAEERTDHKILQAFPFSSELKHMTSISNTDGRIVSYVKGSPECVMAMCDLSEDKKAEINLRITEFQQKAGRIIAFAHKQLDRMEDYEQDAMHAAMENGMHFDGFAVISDPLRPEVRAAVAECFKAGIDLKILTGDNIVTAQAIAEELDLLGTGRAALEAWEIDRLNDRELLLLLPSIAVIARSTPLIKMRIVNLLKSSGNVVAVTGDGINDAPALKNADVGIAMGISGTDVSKEASDIVLLDDSFATIVSAVAWGREIYENFKRFIRFQLTVNLSSVAAVFSSVLLGFGAPFTALQLLWVNIIMDGPPALTLGLEPAGDNPADRGPAKRSESILSRDAVVKIVITSAYITAVFLAQTLFNFLGAAPAETSTVLFTLFALIQLFNAFNCRELHNQSIFKNFFNNRIMIVTFLITFVFQYLITTYAGAFFGTVALSGTMWLKLLATGASVIVFSEVCKAVARLFRKNNRI